MGWRVEYIFTEQTTEAKVVILHPVSVFTSECKNLVAIGCRSKSDIIVFRDWKLTDIDNLSFCNTAEMIRIG